MSKNIENPDFIQNLENDLADISKNIEDVSLNIRIIENNLLEISKNLQSIKLKLRLI